VLRELAQGASARGRGGGGTGGGGGGCVPFSFFTPHHHIGHPFLTPLCSSPLCSSHSCPLSLSLLPWPPHGLLSSSV